MSIVRVTPESRFYLLGRRVHHGLYGVWRIVSGLVLVLHDWRDRTRPSVRHRLYGAWRIATGLALVVDDWHDRPWPTRDREW